jgi:hypothetical protein
MQIHFDSLKPFSSENYSILDRVVGLYFIALTKSVIPYPFRDSQLIYIGMSEKPSNSIASRLRDHFDGTSGNLGLTNYRVREPLVFTHLNFDAMSSFWRQRIEDLESYFIQDFVARYGVYPICNNKTGFPEFSTENTTQLEIEWEYFERKS